MTDTSPRPVLFPPRRILPTGLRIGTCGATPQACSAPLTLALLAGAALFLLAGCGVGQQGGRPPEPLTVVALPSSQVPCVHPDEAIAGLRLRGLFWSAEGYNARGMKIEFFSSKDGRWMKLETLGTCAKLTEYGDAWHSEERAYAGPEA